MLAITGTGRDVPYDLPQKPGAELGETVSAISGIANQTNLLALNVAFEAARAGEGLRW